MYRRTFDNLSIKNHRIVDLRSDTFVSYQLSYN